jgi:2-methylcitrate dehydratase
MKKSISQQWAEYAVALRYEDLPLAAVREAKRFLLDTLGCALGGSRSEDCEIAREVVLDLGGRPEATVIGSGEKTNAVNAAFLNSLAARVMDYNDVYWKQDPSHPSDLVPAALAAGERAHRTGEDLITAIIIAYDLEMRLCEAAFPGIREIGWHHATLTQFASPVVAGKMLGLTQEQIVNAIGISGSHNATFGAVTAGKLTMMKNTVDPMATQSGVWAALLAQKGYVGPEAIFEGREGLFAEVGCEWGPKKLVDGLGTDFRITQCSMKPFPTEALTHSPITATLNIVQEYDLRPEQIEAVIVTTIARAADILADPSKYEINSKETADHSLPYCLAAAVVDREVTPRQFVPEKLADPRILAMVSKVKAQAGGEYERLFPAMQPCQVEIRTVSGQRFTCRVDYPKGDPRDPLTDRQLKEKFSALADGTLSGERQEEVFDIVHELELVEDIGALMARITTVGSRQQAGLRIED